MSIEQVIGVLVGALQLLISFILYQTWGRLNELRQLHDKNVEAVNDLKLKMSEDFVRRTEWEQIRARLHDLSNWMAAQKAVQDKDTLIQQLKNENS